MPQSARRSVPAHRSTAPALGTPPLNGFFDQLQLSNHVFADIAIADPEHFCAPFHGGSLLLIEFFPGLQHMTEGR